jgi:hypothetical protein
MVHSQIGLNYFLDDCHFGYITKSCKKTLVQCETSSWSWHWGFRVLVWLSVGCKMESNVRPLGHGIEGARFSGIWVGCRVKLDVRPFRSWHWDFQVLVELWVGGKMESQLVMALRVLVEFGLGVKMESNVRVPFVHGIDGLALKWTWVECKIKLNVSPFGYGIEGSVLELTLSWVQKS